MQKTLLAAIAIIIVGVGIYQYTKPAGTDSQGAAATAPAQTDSSDAAGGTVLAGSDANVDAADQPVSGPVSAAVVAQHATEADCWTIVSGKVYDVTSVIAGHPGGPDKIIAVCGKNGTSEFQEMNKFAQGNAMSALESLYKGDLAQ